jgi:hypothetical protein
MNIVSSIVVGIIIHEVQLVAIKVAYHTLNAVFPLVTLSNDLQSRPKTD